MTNPTTPTEGQDEIEQVRLAQSTMIMGKSIDEVCVILSALELERIADMKMTMSKLDEWMKLVREDHCKAVQKALDKSMEDMFMRIAQLKKKLEELK